MRRTKHWNGTSAESRRQALSEPQSRSLWEIQRERVMDYMQDEAAQGGLLDAGIAGAVTALLLLSLETGAAINERLAIAINIEQADDVGADIHKLLGFTGQIGRLVRLKSPGK